MEAVEKIKEIVDAMDGDELNALAAWVLSPQSGLIDDDELRDAVIVRGCEPECKLDHVDDLDEFDVARLAEDIGMIDVNGHAVERLSDAVAEGRTRDALDIIKQEFGGPEPKLATFLAEIRGRAA